MENVFKWNTFKCCTEISDNVNSRLFTVNSKMTCSLSLPKTVNGTIFYFKSTWTFTCPVWFITIFGQYIVRELLAWQLDDNGYGNVNVFGLGGIDLRCCWIAAAVGYCCCCRLLLLQSKYRNLLLPINMPIQCCEYLRHTAAAQVSYIITCSRSVQVELGKVEGFRGTA